MIVLVAIGRFLGCAPDPALVKVEPLPPTSTPVAPEPVPAGLVELVGGPELKRRLFSPSGRTRLINLWATWCPPCREEMPRIRDWAASHPEVEVVLVNVDLVPLQARKVEPFIRAQQLEHLTNWQLNAKDPAYALQSIIPDWPESLPVTLLVGEDGTVKKQFNRVIGKVDLAGLP